MIDDLLTAQGLPPRPEPLPRPVIDAHTHLDTTVDQALVPLESLLAAAAGVGVAACAQIGCDLADSRWAVERAAEQPSLIAAVALHPNEVARHPDTWRDDLASLDELLAGRHDRVRAVGETGLDYFRTTDPTGQAAQREAFAAHAGLAQRHDLTLAIHDRDAHGDIADVLDAEGWPERVVFHCFSGDAAFARRCLDHGAWLSFAGNVTYKANARMREALLVAPQNKVLVETDAPYLTPLPHRGRTNASYLVPHTARAIAEYRGEALADVCDALWANAEAAYGGAWVERPTA